MKDIKIEEYNNEVHIKQNEKEIVISSLDLDDFLTNLLETTSHLLSPTIRINEEIMRAVLKGEYEIDNFNLHLLEFN